MFQVGEALDKSGLAFNFSRGGFQGGEGSDNAAEWWIEGVLEELDAPNEYFFDEASRLLFWNYNGSTEADFAPPPTDLELVVPSLSVFIHAQGSAEAPVRGLTVENLKFTAGRPTFMDPHGVPSGGDWALERQGVVLLEYTEDSLIIGNNFTRIDGNAVFLSGYNRRTVIRGNAFEWLGQNAIASWGRSDEYDGRNGDQPLYTVVSDNFMRELGLIQKQSSCYFQAQTAMTLITHNICFNIPRAGINFDDGFGGGNEIEKNLLFSTCRESGDHGAFNSWDRMPYLTTFRDGVTPSVIPAWNDVHHNFIVANYHADGGCLDNDDGSAWYKIHHNFCVFGGHKSDFDGHSKQSFNNIHVYSNVYGDACIAVIAQQLPLQGFDEVYVNNTCILASSDDPYLRLDSDCQIPSNPAAFSIVLQNNRIYAPQGRVTVQYAKTVSFQAFQQAGYDEGSVVDGQMPSAATIIAWGKKLLGNQFLRDSMRKCDLAHI